MKNIRIAHLASLVCFAGATFGITYGLLAIPFPYAQNNYGWDEILLALACVGMIAVMLPRFQMYASHAGHHSHSA